MHHRVLRGVGLHLADAAWCDRGWMKRNDPCDPSGPNAAHRHQGADRECHHHHRGGEQAAVERDCRQAAAESCGRQQAQRVGRSVMHQAEAYRVVRRSGAVSADET